MSRKSVKANVSDGGAAVLNEGTPSAAKRSGSGKGASAAKGAAPKKSVPKGAASGTRGRKPKLLAQEPQEPQETGVPLIAPELPSLGAFLVGVLIFLALISHSASDYHIADVGGEYHNYIGFAGAFLSRALIKYFGLASFFPVFVLLLCPYYTLTKKGRSVSRTHIALGLSLSVFSVLALLSLIFPDKLDFPWPGECSGGGLLGDFLIKGLKSLSGRVGAFLLLPGLFLLGFYLFTGATFRGLIRFFSVFRLVPLSAEGDREKESERGKSKEGEGDKAKEGEGPELIIRNNKASKNARQGALEEGAKGEAFCAAGGQKRKGGPRPEGGDHDKDLDGLEGLDGLDGLDDLDDLDKLLDPDDLNSPGPLRFEALEEGRKGGLRIRDRAKSKSGKTKAGKHKAGYRIPDCSLLDPTPTLPEGHSSGLSEEELMGNARLLETKLREFGVSGRVLEVSGGPVITMYEYQPAPGVKISKVAGLANDLAMAMKAASIRVVAPIPGKAAIGLELPNHNRYLVTLRELIESPAYARQSSPLTLVLGVDITGNPVVTDLGKMPHLLIAGATGSGKSVGLDSMIMSILFKAGPDRVKFIMIDPKCVELAMYQDLPHLLHPVLTDPGEATNALKWAVHEMDFRYKLMAERGVRNIAGYNEKIREELKGAAGKLNFGQESQKDFDLDEGDPPLEMPYLVIIIDELSDLMLTSPKDTEVSIMRLCAKARASGIHLILATQRPSVDVLTGVIKANLPTRISFQVATKIDSRTILDQVGAEQLLGKGDMLFQPPGTSKLSRLHGAYVSDEEKKRVTDFIRSFGPPDYIENLAPPEAEDEDGLLGEKDEKFEEAVELVRRSGRATISHIQRHLRIGYNRAARIIEDMEREGVIGPQDGTKPRVIF
jgi:S-DNA-T family DNA segregation ATPase FtsK/SpoIIIE